MAEEANRVWRSGRLFARIRTEKDGNRKRKRDTAHDAVGSSGAGEPSKFSGELKSRTESNVCFSLFLGVRSP